MEICDLTIVRAPGWMVIMLSKHILEWVLQNASVLCDNWQTIIASLDKYLIQQNLFLLDIAL